MPYDTPRRDFCISSHTIGPAHPIFLIAEIGQTHDGSLGTAHAYIDSVARAGVNAVKFQTHLAAAESTQAEDFRVSFSRQDATRYDYWRRTAFTLAQWRELAAHAAAVGILFLSSPFSCEAVEWLEEIGVAAWKVGAGELGNAPMIERIRATGRPILLSTGLVNWATLDRIADSLGSSPFAFLQCTAAYPCPPAQLGLNVLAQLRDRYKRPVGLSDHSGTIYAGIAAAALGAHLIEVHTVFSRECFGPDVAASVTTGELRQLVEGVRFVEAAIRSPVDKDAIAKELEPVRVLFSKSCVASRAIRAGELIAPADIAFKKPGTGVPAADWGKLVGRRARVDLNFDTILLEEYFD